MRAAARSLQVQSKGHYWAGRAALAARPRRPTATAISSAPRPIPSCSTASSRSSGSAARCRAARAAADLCGDRRAARGVQQPAAWSRRCGSLGQQGRRDEQALFVRALAESLDNDAERVLAIELGQQIGRQDLAVWVARMARVKGSAFYVAPGLSDACRRGRRRRGCGRWPTASPARKARSTAYAVSHAGARGMMQLMPGTAREQAGKMGVGYDSYRLTSDPVYNVMLGSAYFQRMLNIWDGNVPLAVASYNAGLGQRPQMGQPLRRPARPARTCCSGSSRSRSARPRPMCSG